MLRTSKDNTNLHDQLKHLIWLGIVLACVGSIAGWCSTRDGGHASMIALEGGTTVPSDYYDFADSISTDGAGTTTNFAYMGDSNTDTYATITSDAGGIDQVYSFTNIDPDWSYVQVRIGFSAGGFNVRIYADTSSTPTTDRGVFGAMAGNYNINIGTVTTGSFYLRIYSTASAGSSVYVHSLALNLVDNTAPTWRSDFMPTTGTWYSANPSLHVRFDEDCILLGGFYDLNDWAGETDNLMFYNINTDYWERTSWTMSAPEWDGCGQGSNTLYFYVTQTGSQPGGSVGAWSWTFNKDTVAPGAPSNVQSTTHTASTWSSTRQIGVSWTAASDSSPSSGFSGYCICWSHGAKDPGSVVNSTGTSATSPVLADAGNWYFNIKSRDGVGLWSPVVSIGPFCIDNTAPTITGLTSTSHTVDTWSASTDVTVSWTGADGTGSGISGYNVLWAASPTDPGTGSTNTATSPLTNVDMDDGAWYFNIRARDTAGFWSVFSWIGPFKVDGNEPEVPSPSSTSHVAGTWSNDNRVNVSWVRTSDGGGSGIAGYDYSWSSGAAMDPGTMNVLNSTEVSVELGEGTWYFNIRAVDRVGAWCAYTSIGPFMIDTVAPTIAGPTSLALDAGTAGNTVTLNFTDLHPLNYTILLDGLALNSSEPWIVSGEFVIPVDGLGVGSHVLTFLVQDEAGNVKTFHLQIDVRQSNTGPTGLDTTTMVVLIGGGIALVGLVAVGVSRKARKPKMQKRGSESTFAGNGTPEGASTPTKREGDVPSGEK